MFDWRELSLLLRLSGSAAIARRYFVTNGFDGALALVGLCMGFYAAGGVAPAIAAKACLGTGLALGISGISSTYISEKAERRKALRELAQAMLKDMENTTHSRAARLVPVVIAAVSGLAPLCIAIMVSSPLLLVAGGVALPVDALWAAIGVALFIVFLLGTFLGHLSGMLWLWSGVQTLLVALASLFLLSFL